MWTGITLLLALVAGKIFITDYYRIPQNGMYPACQVAASCSQPSERTQIHQASSEATSSFSCVRKTGSGHNYIWRVIALPGEKVETSGESLAINGRAASGGRFVSKDGETVFQEQIGDALYRSPSSVAESRPPDVSLRFRRTSSS